MTPSLPFAPTLPAAIFGDRYLAYHKARLKPRAYEREEGIMRLYLKPFFSSKFSTIRRADIQRYITGRAGRTGKDKVSPYSIQKEVNLIKHLFRLAVEWELVRFSPAQGIKSPKAPAGRVRYLQPTELATLLKAAPEWLRPIIALAVTTGMRRGEILGLRWLDVDLDAGRVLLPQTKNGEGRIVYLNALAQDVLRSLPADSEAKPTDKLFPIRADWVTGAFRRVCVKIELQDFRFHDLRHTAASRLRMQGADIHTVAQILGHKDLRMAARYQHLSPTFLSEAVNRLNGVFGDWVRALSHQSVTKLLVTPSDVPVKD